MRKNLNENVIFLKLFPGISEIFVTNILNLPNLKGVVLETFGSGNAPTDKWFIDALSLAILNEILIINVSQCIGGKVVQGNYQTSRFLEDIGIVSGVDITAEAAITKLMVVLGLNLDYKEAAFMLKSNLAGEIS